MSGDGEVTHLKKYSKIFVSPVGGEHQELSAEPGGEGLQCGAGTEGPVVLLLLRLLLPQPSRTVWWCS